MFADAVGPIRPDAGDAKVTGPGDGDVLFHAYGIGAGVKKGGTESYTSSKK